MMKKWLAGVLAIWMLVAMVGCAATETTVSETDEAVETVPETETSATASPTIRVRQRVYNSEELMNFIGAIYMGTEASYENTMKEANGHEVTYSMMFDGRLCTMTRGEYVDGQYQTTQGSVQQFLLRLMAQNCTSEEELLQKLKAAGLAKAYEQYPMHLFYGVCELCAIVDGETYVIDYYLDEATIEQIDQFILLQSLQTQA